MPIVLSLLIAGLATAPHPGVSAGAVSGATARQGDTVVLLHGLARSSASMRRMERSLRDAGFEVCNIDYPSTDHPIEVLAEQFVLPAVKDCAAETAGSVHFVTHSMGGILVRYLSESHLYDRMDRVVMLSPPNHGSQAVDRLGNLWLFRKIHGPAGSQLGTDSLSVPQALGPPDFEVGVITGSRTINLLLSALIKGKDDGKVSIESARLEGMDDFLVVPSAHPFIMRNREAIQETIYFLEHGSFSEGAPTP